MDLNFSAYSNNINIFLRGINPFLEDNKIFGIDLLSGFNDSLVTYGIKNNYSLTNATIYLSYLGMDYSDEDNLKLFKCDDWDFENQNCLDSWRDVTSNSSKDISSKIFEYDTLDFSGFMIKEITPEIIEIIGGSSDSSTSSSTGSTTPITDTEIVFDSKDIETENLTIVCVENWFCSEWGPCTFENIQIRECSDNNECNTTIDKPQEEKNCVFKT